MQTRRLKLFTTIRTEGGLLPADLMQQISELDGKIEGLKPTDYHLIPGEKLNEAINRSWNRLVGAWKSFKKAIETTSGEIGDCVVGAQHAVPKNEHHPERALHAG